tara:strand:+ start:741 stop:941 length:201 start_codon:yes stop_codon:yes gene_type:complete
MEHLKAILKKLEGQRDITIADLQVYLTAPVGIGEHPGIGHEIEIFIGQIDDVEGKIDVIKKLIASR